MKTAAELMKIDAPLRISFSALKDGSAVMRDIEDIAAAFNTTLVRSAAIHPLCVEAATNGLNALQRAVVRFEKHGTLGLDGAGIEDIGVALDLHAQLCSKSSPIQLVEALRVVMETI